MNRPLRICLIASSRFPVQEPFMGGLEAHTHALAGSSSGAVTRSACSRLPVRTRLWGPPTCR